VDAARHQRWSAERGVRTSGLLHRRAARQALLDADFEVNRATAALNAAQAVAAAHASRHANARREVQHVRDELRRHDVFSRMNDHIGTTEFLHRRLDALSVWSQWAAGADVPTDRLGAAVEVLLVEGAADPPGRSAALGHTIEAWARSTGVELDLPSHAADKLARRGRTMELGL
jgi:hypothetical protein